MVETLEMDRNGINHLSTGTEFLPSAVYNGRITLAASNERATRSATI